MYKEAQLQAYKVILLNVPLNFYVGGIPVLLHDSERLTTS